MNKKIYQKNGKKRNTFKIKSGYYLELVTPETTKLLESTKKMIIKD